MLRCIWPALTLNPLSIHVTFTSIVPGAYPREAKMCKNVLKWRTFELTGWITGKQLKIDGYMLRCVWQALNPLFIHVTFTEIVPESYPWEAKMCIRLIAETDARFVGYSHPSCINLWNKSTIWKNLLALWFNLRTSSLWNIGLINFCCAVR